MLAEGPLQLFPEPIGPVHRRRAVQRCFPDMRPSPIRGSPTTGRCAAARKVHNTDHRWWSPDGRDRTAVLTDRERRAIVEYLKTL